jgi:hypothetical protein
MLGILVVDDEPDLKALVQQKFRHQISRALRVRGAGAIEGHAEREFWKGRTAVNYWMSTAKLP